MILECYEILKQMEYRPVMWTGENTLRSINIYISGYFRGFEASNGVINHKEDFFFDWVAEKLGYYESTAGWVNMIMAYSMGFEPKSIVWEDFFNTPVSDEKHLKSIKLFYDLLEQYKNEMELASENSFFITTMPKSRPVDYCLGYSEGSVYIDFNNFDNELIYLKRISFDGYGCCELREKIIPLDKKDSQNFKTIFQDNLKDQNLLFKIVKKAILLNQNYIWNDALKEYNLI